MENFTPYGLVEKAVVDKFGFDNYDHELTNDTCYMIDRANFDILKRKLNGITVECTYEGMYTLVTKWWLDWDVLEALTNGDTKESQEYIDAENYRFNMDNAEVEAKFEEVLESLTPATVTTAGAVVDANPDVGAQLVDELEEELGDTVREIRERLANPPEQTEEEIAAEELEKVLDEFRVNNYSITNHEGRFIATNVNDATPLIRYIFDNNMFEGQNVVIPNDRVYGDVDTEFLSLYRRVDAVVIHAPGTSGSYARCRAQFGDDLRARPSVSGDEIKAGCYVLAGRTEDGHINMRYSADSTAKASIPAILTMLKSLNGEAEDYVADLAFDELSRMFEFVHKTEDGHFTGSDNDTLGKTMLSLADHYKCNVVFGAEGRNFTDKTVRIVRKRSGNKREDTGFTILGFNVDYIFTPDSIGDCDAVYRDTLSNIVFGYKKGDVLTILSTTLPADVFIKGVIARDNAKCYEDIEASDKAIYDGDIQKSIDKYTEKFTEDVMKTVNKNKKDLKVKEEAYKELMDSAMILGSDIRSLQLMTNSFDAERLTRDNKEIALKDYNAILSIPDVSSVFVDDNHIHVFTNNIYVQSDDTDKWYDIGTFKISVLIGANEYSKDLTRILNTKNYADAFQAGMNAPHVFAAGNLCHGNVMRGISDSYKNRDMFGVIIQLIYFLQEANLDDPAGNKLTRWKEVSAEVATGGSTDAEVIYGVPEGIDLEALMQTVI